MSRRSPILTKFNRGKSIALGLVAAFSVATVGFAGTSFAQGGGSASLGAEGSVSAATSKEDCKRDGWKRYGFHNQGRCIAAVQAHGHGQGHGYGGGNTPAPTPNANAWWNFDISGDNNVVNIVINYIFG